MKIKYDCKHKYNDKYLQNYNDKYKHKYSEKYEHKKMTNKTKRWVGATRNTAIMLHGTWFLQTAFALFPHQVKKRKDKVI